MPTTATTPQCGNRTTFEIALDPAASLKLRGIWETHGRSPRSGLFAFIRFPPGTEEAVLRGIILDEAPRRILDAALAEIKTTTAHHDLGEL